MKNIFLSASACLISSLLYSQNWEWVKQVGSTTPDNGFAITSDNSGNCYTAGVVSDHQFLAKYNSSGELIWNSDSVAFKARGIAIDNSMNLYITGRGVPLSKHDTSGAFIWAKAVNAEGFSISIDVLNNCYVTGMLTDTAIFDSFTLNYPGAFIAKYDSSGNCVWAKKTDATKSNAISTDASGNIYVTGSFTDTVFFDSEMLICSGNRDIFIAKYSNNGNCMWAKRAGGNSEGSYSNDEGLALITDLQGNLYVTGSVIDTADFDSFSLNGGLANDIFIAKYNADGNALWVKRAGGPIDDEGRSIALDPQGNIFIGGSYLATAYFENVALTGWSNYDAFIAKYDNNGNFIDITNAGGTIWNEFVYGITIDDSGNCFVTGSFCGTSFFDSDSLVSNGNSDLFVAKIGNLTSLNEIAATDFNFIIYPNPASNILTIETTQPGKATYIIYNLTGSLLQSGSLSQAGKKEIDISGFAEGVYIIQLQTELGEVRKKFVKQ